MGNAHGQQHGAWRFILAPPSAGSPESPSVVSTGAGADGLTCEILGVLWAHLERRRHTLRGANDFPSNPRTTPETEPQRSAQMDEPIFDRIAKTLVTHGARRDAVKTLAGSALAAVLSRRDEFARAKHHRHHHKKRCRKLAQSCGRKKKCCNKSGLVKCGLSSSPVCEDQEKHCCGVEGAVCFKTEANNGGACECCAGFLCVGDNAPERSHCVPEGT